LALHRKPIAFQNPGGYWDPFFQLIRHTVDHRLTPAWVLETWTAVEQASEILPALRASVGAD
jgi:predicted Rossmann-fold nucleotide-binding protein